MGTNSKINERARQNRENRTKLHLPFTNKRRNRVLRRSERLPFHMRHPSWRLIRVGQCVCRTFRPDQYINLNICTVCKWASLVILFLHQQSPCNIYSDRFCTKIRILETSVKYWKGREYFGYFSLRYVVLMKAVIYKKSLKQKICTPFCRRIPTYTIPTCHWWPSDYFVQYSYFISNNKTNFLQTDVLLF